MKMVWMIDNEDGRSVKVELDHWQYAWSQFHSDALYSKLSTGWKASNPCDLDRAINVPDAR